MLVNSKMSLNDEDGEVSFQACVEYTKLSGD